MPTPVFCEMPSRTVFNSSNTSSLSIVQIIKYLEYINPVESKKNKKASLQTCKIETNKRIS